MNLAVIITAAASLVAAEPGQHIEWAARELSQLPPRAWLVKKSILPVTQYMPPLEQAYQATLDASQPSASEPTDYQKLDRIFRNAKGNVPSDAELESWRSGRLYREEEPKKPIGAVIIGARVQDPNDRRVLIPYFHDGPAHEVDQPTEALALRIRKESIEKVKDAASPSLDRGSLSFKLAKQGQFKNYTDFFDLRAAGDLWVMRWERVNPIRRQVHYVFFDRKTRVRP